MRPLQLVIAALLGGCLVLVTILVTTPSQCAVQFPTPRIPVPTQIVDTGCWSCGSGSGPSAADLMGYFSLADDERVIGIDGQQSRPTTRAELAALLDESEHRQRFHGQFLDFEIQSPRGERRVLLLLH